MPDRKSEHDAGGHPYPKNGKHGCERKPKSYASKNADSNDPQPTSLKLIQNWRTGERRQVNYGGEEAHKDPKKKNTPPPRKRFAEKEAAPKPKTLISPKK